MHLRSVVRDDSVGRCDIISFMKNGEIVYVTLINYLSAKICEHSCWMSVSWTIQNISYMPMKIEFKCVCRCGQTGFNSRERRKVTTTLPVHVMERPRQDQDMLEIKKIQREYVFRPIITLSPLTGYFSFFRMNLLSWLVGSVAILTFMVLMAWPPTEVIPIMKFCSHLRANA